jgi:hypothetical protein
MIQCFVGGDSTPTLPHHLETAKELLPIPALEEATEVGSKSSNSGIWMWLYGRGQPRLVTVAEAEQMCKERTRDARRLAAETLKQHIELFEVPLSLSKFLRQIIYL